MYNCVCCGCDSNTRVCSQCVIEKMVIRLADVWAKVTELENERDQLIMASASDLLKIQDLERENAMLRKMVGEERKAKRRRLFSNDDK